MHSFFSPTLVWRKLAPRSISSMFVGFLFTCTAHFKSPILITGTLISGLWLGQDLSVSPVLGGRLTDILGHFHVTRSSSIWFFPTCSPHVRITGVLHDTDWVLSSCTKESYVMFKFDSPDSKTEGLNFKGKYLIRLFTCTIPQAKFIHHLFWPYAKGFFLLLPLNFFTPLLHFFPSCIACSIF